MPGDGFGRPPPETGIVIHVNGVEDWSELGRDLERIRLAARAALSSRPGAGSGDLSVTFVDDAEIERLNVEWLHRSGPTDVIAFSLGSHEALVGDIYIAPDTAARNAARFGAPLDEEILRLVIHGTLHVLGHEHPEDDDRERSEMYRLQEELLRSLPDPTPGDADG